MYVLYCDEMDFYIDENNGITWDITKAKQFHRFDIRRWLLKWYLEEYKYDCDFMFKRVVSLKVDMSDFLGIKIKR